MDIPALRINPRDREFKLYDNEERRALVIAYMFDGVPYRDLDRDILNVKPGPSGEIKGFQSMGTLHHLGLYDDFKGLFAGYSVSEALSELPDTKEFKPIREILSGRSSSDDFEIDDTYEGEINFEGIEGGFSERIVRIRKNQNIFRKKILNAYNSTCCITGIREPRFLVASHIKPWRDSDPREKLDVHNGLCLNSLHDSAFDQGLMTVDSSSYEVKFSPNIEDAMPRDVFDKYFGIYDGKVLEMEDEALLPDESYLSYHNRKIFCQNPKSVKITLDFNLVD